MDDINNQVERASLLPNRYYLILNYEDEDSFSMTAYDTTKGNTVDLESVPAGMANSFKKELNSDKTDEIIDKVVAREDNIVKVDFGEKQ